MDGICFIKSGRGVINFKSLDTGSLLLFLFSNIDAQIIQGSNIQVSENREILRVIIDSLIFMARQNIALRGHDESTFSTNQGNFLELIKMFAKYHPTLQHHLNIIEQHKRNRLTFLSHETQNKLLSITSNIVRSKILDQVKKAGIFSVIIDTLLTYQN